MRFSLRRFGYVLFICFLAFSVNCVSAEPESTVLKDKPWKERTWEERVYNAQYDDRYTFKHGIPYTLDPWTWTYTKEFAERFRMPNQWIDPELKGALAIAWRMVVLGDTMCGLGRKEDACMKPLRCQLDMYYDNSIKLPWKRPEIIRDSRITGLTSSRFLEVPPKKWPPDELGSPIGGGAFRHGKYIELPGYLAYFDQELQPGVGLISWLGTCPSYVGPETVFFSFPNLDDWDRYQRGEIIDKDVRTAHRVEFPRRFLERSKALYDIQNKPNFDFQDSLIKQFFDNRNKKN